MLYNLNINYKNNFFLLFNSINIDLNICFLPFNEHTGFSSQLYTSSDDKYLIKAEVCKYLSNKNFFSWFFRDFLKKFYLLDLDAKKEHNGYKVAQAAGLNTPSIYSWGVSLLPCNNIISLLIIDYRKDVLPGLVYFNSLTSDNKENFIVKLGYEAVKLAKHGYVHKDLHLNNFLIDNEKNIIWIDNHFRKLSRNKNKKWKQIVNSLDEKKLQGEKNKKLILSVFKKIFIDYC